MDSIIPAVPNLYSHDRQEPREPIQRIRLADGTTKTDFGTFTAQDLLDNNITGPYTRPSFNVETQFLSWNSDTLKYTVNENDTLTSEQIEGVFRGERERKLASIDWTVLPDAPLTDSQKEEMKVYRQALRDMPQNMDITSLTEESYEAIVWPEYPTFLP